MSKKTLRERIANHNNDYSLLEPFSPAEPISTTIVIPVYNGIKMFEKTLQSLVKQPEIMNRPDNFEIIVVNDGSTEDVTEVCKTSSLHGSVSSPVPCPVSFVQLKENQGRSSARNIGLEHANGNLVFFLDSDVVVPEYFFHPHWNIHRAAERTGVSAVVLGMAENVQLNDLRIDGGYFPDMSKDFRKADDGKDWFPQRRKSKLLEESENLKYFHDADFTLQDLVVTHSLSLPTALARAVGGFNTSFRGWGYEDTHFGAKLMAASCFLIPCQETGVFKIQHKARKGNMTKECYANKKIYQQLLDEAR